MSQLHATSTADDVAGTTRDRLLNLTEELIQTVGYNAFSYRDLAERTGITTASIHYHFRTKDDLGQAVVARYISRLIPQLAEIDAAVATAHGRVRRFADLFVNSLGPDFRMCICGMLSAEQRTLTAALNREIVQFFQTCETWLTRTLKAGGVGGPSPARTARIMLATLEGAMLVARVTGDASRLTEAAAAILAPLRRPSTTTGR